jgi:hypothetical protein
MMNPTVLWTDEWQVYLVGGQLLVLVVAAVFGGWQVWEARTLRLQQNRPFVVIDFEVEASNLIYLEVANLGTSLARDVRVVIDPPLQSTAGVRLDQMKMLNEGISTLVPSKRIKTFFDAFHARKDPELPMRHSATVTYTDERGRRSYEEKFDLDLDLYRYLSTITRRNVHDLHKQLEEIRKILGGWSANIGRGMVAMSAREAREREDQIINEMDGPADDRMSRTANRIRTAARKIRERLARA